MRYALLLAFMFQTSSTDLITSKFEGALRPYFQNAKIVLQPQTHALLGLTCIEGAGSDLAKVAAESLGEHLGQNGLMDIGTRVFLAANSYRYVLIGFDTYVAGFDLQTKQSYYKPIPNSAYSQMYRQECRLGPSAAVNDGICDNCK
jgi:hypothetical protein